VLCFIFDCEQTPFDLLFVDLRGRDCVCVREREIEREIERAFVSRKES
jgi:hypothetical protein